MSSITINNAFYEELGERWYRDDEHIIALLRAESEEKTAYVREVLSRQGITAPARLLDIGCGAGFISNQLAALGYQVDGIDQSPGSLNVARAYAQAGSAVNYRTADAYALPFENASYDAVLMLDFLEHVEDPTRAIREAARVLRPGGILIYYTFNRNPLAGLLAIKAVSFVARDCPKNFHLLSMFIKPKELDVYLRAARLQPGPRVGLRPVFGCLGFWSTLLRRRVHKGFRFTQTKSLTLGYMGEALRLS